MKIDPLMWIAADFECMNIPIIDNDNDNVTDKLFINKSIAIGYNIVKKPDYENLNWKKMVLSNTLVKIVMNGL